MPEPDVAQFESDADECAKRLLEQLVDERDEWRRRHTRSQIVGAVCTLLAFILGKVL